MVKTSIARLAELGQSIWIDNISRSMIQSGRLKRMIDLGLLGMTSNPTIFDKSISTSNDYDEKIEVLSSSGKSTFQIYDDLTVRDVQDAADIFRNIYERTNALDGYVSLEVNPHLSSAPKETIKEAKRLFKMVDRPNVMFKIPATEAGFEAIEALLAQGININVTLIFSISQYEKTSASFLNGMKRLIATGGDPNRIGSVASVFVSRIDTVVDEMLDERIATSKYEAIEKLLSLKGKAAVANSHLIFGKYKEIFSGSEFGRLKAKGAKVQRVLWGSTSTKNPAYSDIKYVSELIAKDTVNTVPENTFYAFLDHGVANEALTPYVKKSQELVDKLTSYGIDIHCVCTGLLEDGVKAFMSSFDSLLNAIEKKAKSLCKLR